MNDACCRDRLRRVLDELRYVVEVKKRRVATYQAVTPAECDDAERKALALAAIATTQGHAVAVTKHWPPSLQPGARRSEVIFRSG